MELADECKLSFYEELCILHENDKTKIVLVKCNLDNKIYIKKIITSYNKDVYDVLKCNPHKNIVKVYEIIETSNSLVVIEEFINGRDLEEVLNNKEISSEERVREYVFQLCNALEHIHGLDIPVIHRDIKPSNVMLTTDNIIKLIDFDASRTFKEDNNKVKDTVLLGTAGFAPPEQYGFAQTDCRSDIYAVGVLMNYLLIGKHPNEEMYNGKLTNVIKKCTNLVQSERYSSVADLKKDINNKPFKIGYENNSSWTIPGFRSKNLWKMIVGCIGYLLILVTGLGLTTENVNYPVTDKIAFFLAMISMVAVFSNYKNISSYLPMVRSKVYIIKVIGYIVFSVAILFLCVLIGIFLDNILTILL